MDKLAFNKTAEIRKDYFYSKGIADVPYDQDGRYSKAKEFLEQTPPNYESATMLFDKIDDFDHAGFLVLMGSVYAAEDSPYYNLEESLKFFKKAYIYSENTDQKIQISKEILSGYFSFKGIESEDYPHTYDDPFVLETILFLRSQNIEPETVSQNKEIQKGQFYEAGIYGAGNGVGKDAEKSIALYRGYLETGEAGYFSATYKNLAIRYALGLGCDQNIKYAHSLIRTGRIILEDIPYGSDDPIFSLISKVKAEEQTHSYTYRNIASRYNKTESAWSFFDIIHDADPYDRSAVINALSLYTILAKREKWKDIEDWEKLYNYALSHFSVEFKDKIKILSTDERLLPEKFHPQILQQEEDRLYLRDQRIRMYEYFRDHDLGIAPADQKERYQLALRFRNQQRINYDAIHVLFDPEEDAENADWLHLIGCVYDEARQYFNPKKAFSYYKKASELGNGEASHRIGLKYEKGENVPFDLDRAWHYFSIAESQGFKDFSVVYHRVKKVISDLNEISASKSSRRRIFEIYPYFRNKGINEVPVKSSDRLLWSQTFTVLFPPQYNNAYALFIEEIDGNDADWLTTIAFIMDQHLDNQDLFNPQKAETFNKKAVELGSSMAAFNLGVKYHSGYETEIDLDEALKWYQKSLDIGHSKARVRIAKILEFQRELDGYKEHDLYTEEIIGLYSDAANLDNDLTAYFTLAKINLNGAIGNRSTELGMIYYALLFSKDPSYVDQDTYALAALNMAVRHFLGFDVEKDNRAALEYLEKIPERSNRPIVRDYMQKIKRTLKQNINKELNPKNVNLEIIQSLYDRSEKIQETIKKMDSHLIKASDQLSDYIVWGKWLSLSENWPSRYDWNDLMEAVEAHQLKFSFEAANRSTKDSGPRYNLLDERGLPILGVLVRPSSNDREEQQQRVVTGSYVPQPGLIRLNSIKGNPDRFKYVGNYSESLPAMLTIEDMQVSEVLVFGNPKKGPMFPSLSIETENNDEYGKGADGSGNDKALAYKIFSPQWIAYTDFGRTLWITDYLIGQWCWNPEKYQIGLPDECASPELHYMARDFIKDLRLTGGRDGGASSVRVMIQPKSSYIQPEAPEIVYKQEYASVHIKQMTMKVYGSYILREGGVENRSLFEEDPNFAQGRTVKKLTERYNDIMRLDPRFERAQQLMGLFYGHLRLWEIGYRPSNTLQEELSEKLNAMESLGREKDEKLLVRRAFGLRPY